MTVAGQPAIPSTLPPADGAMPHELPGAPSADFLTQPEPEVASEVASIEKGFENTNEFLVDQKDVTQLSGWSIAKTNRFFRAQKESVITKEAKGGAGGVKFMLPIYALPENLREKAIAFLEGVGELTDRNAARDARWAAEHPEKSAEALRRKDIVLAWQVAVAKNDKAPEPLSKTDLSSSFARSRGISSTTLWRWVRDFSKRNLLEDLALGFGAKRGHRTIDDDRWNEVLDHYLDRKHAHRSKDMSAEYYKKRCEQLGEKHVSKSTVCRMLDTPEIDILKYACIHGMRKAMDLYGPYITRTRTEAWPNMAWVGDHYNMDVRVIAPDGKRLITGWYTGWYDYRTTLFVGYHAGETPSSETIQLALLKGIERFGCPDIANVDNGKDYLSELIASLMQGILNIKVIHSIVKNAKAKVIERAFGLWAGRFCPAILGHRGRGKDQRPEALAALEKKTKDAIKAGEPLGLEHGTLMRWDEFVPLVDHFVHWWNTREGSQAEGLDGRSPKQVWESYDNPIRTVDREALWMLWLPVEKATVRKCQVKLMKGVYFREPVGLAKWNGRTVRLRYHPEWLDKVYVHEPETDRLICVAPRFYAVPGYVPLMSEKANEELAEAKRDFKKAIGLQDLAKRKIRDLTFAESAGIPERADLPPQPDASSHPTVPQILSVSQAARDAQAQSLRLVANAPTTAGYNFGASNPINEIYAEPAPPKKKWDRGSIADIATNTTRSKEEDDE